MRPSNPYIHCLPSLRFNSFQSVNKQGLLSKNWESRWRSSFVFNFWPYRGPTEQANFGVMFGWQCAWKWEKGWGAERTRRSHTLLHRWTHLGAICLRQDLSTRMSTSSRGTLVLLACEPHFEQRSSSLCWDVIMCCLSSLGSLSSFYTKHEEQKEKNSVFWDKGTNGLLYQQLFRDCYYVLVSYDNDNNSNTSDNSGSKLTYII